MQRWLLLSLLAVLGMLQAHALAANGTIAANPNPCRITAGKTCTSYITWTTQGMTHARVYVVDSHKRGSGSRGAALSSITVTATK